MTRKTLLATAVAAGALLAPASPAFAVGTPTAPPPVTFPIDSQVAVGAAIGPEEPWHRLVEARVNFKLNREIVYRFSIGHTVTHADVDITERSHGSIHLEASFIAIDTNRNVYIGVKRCFATLTFGGGDFPAPRVIHCAPEGEHNWAPR